MLNLQNNRTTIVYGAAAISLAILGSSVAYYIIEDDKKVKHRREIRRSERNALRLLQQLKEQVQEIEQSIEKVESNVDNQACDDKEFKKKEYTLAHSNELLLQLMEKLDAIRPLIVIMGTNEMEKEPSEYEQQLVSNIKGKKRTVIGSIEGLFRRLDVAKITATKEAERREAIAKEKARLEKEESERKALEEQEREELRKENERKAIEEQERVAQEEGLRRAKEEEERLAQEALEKELEQKVNSELIEEAAATTQEEAVLAAMKEVEDDEK